MGVIQAGRYRWQTGISVLLAGVVLGAAQAASAFSIGQTSDQFMPNAASGCNNCHSGGTTPTVSLTGPTSVLPGSTNVYTFTINNPATQAKGGFNVAAPDGIFSIGGPDSVRTQILANGSTGALEITHLGAKVAVSGVTTFTFQWTAPNSFTSVALTGWGNAVNFDHTNMGDAAASSTLVVSSAGVQASTPTMTPTATATNTATAVPTATVTPTSPPTRTRTPTPTRTPTMTATNTATATATSSSTATPSPTAIVTNTATTVPTATATVDPPTATATSSSTATPSPTPSATETVTLPTATDTALVATRTPSASPSATVSSSQTPTSTLTPTPIPCSGDCSQDGMVTVDELVRAVYIALGNGATAECPAVDVNRDGQVTVDEVVQAVNAELQGCF